MSALFSIAAVVEEKNMEENWMTLRQYSKVMFLLINHSSVTKLCSDKV
jgi:hypothetical protein